MSLTDWEAYKSNVNIQFVVETTNQIHGSGSFKVNKGTGSGYFNARRAASPRGFTSGRARWLYQPRTQFQNGLQAGLFFNSSQADLTASGAAYFACIELSATTTNQRLKIYQMTAGIPTMTQLFQGSTFTLTLNSTICLEIEWVLDITRLGGIRFNFKKGSATDFSDLANQTNLTNVVSTTSVLQTSVGEGMGCYVASSTIDHLFDRLSCVPLVVGG